MIFRRRKDSVLGSPLLSDAEWASLRREHKAGHPIAEEKLWPVAVADLTLRQINAQLAVAKSLTLATWVLTIVTGVLVVVQLMPLLRRHWPT